MKSPSDKEEEARMKALIDNTAQAIFNYLNKVENQREIFEKRWIWELLQNALDAAPPDRKIEVEITYKDDILTFRHNGRPFELEEVAHLIYHGSTKQRGEDIGKFGTGFLVTHLLSKRVNVKGVRDDGKTFGFLLNRDATSPDDLKKLMEDTWKEYKGSLGEGSLPYSAEYEYRLESPRAKKTVEAGIEALIKIAPYVLAVNDTLGTIKITNQTNRLKFELVNENNKTGYVKKVVKKETDGGETLFHELWMVKGEEVEIVVEIKKQDDETYQIVDLEGIPKIFLAFPLFGTQDIPFPVIVNSRKFEPTEDRDGIYLGKEETDSIRRNKRLVEEAGKLFIKLISNLDTNRLENAYIWLRLKAPPDKEWLDPDWYKRLLKELIERIRDIKVVRTESGYIPYTEAYFPDDGSGEKEKLERLWEVCYRFSAYRDKIVAKDIVFEWARIIEGWKSLGLDLSDRQLTPEKIAAEIERSGNRENFKTKLATDVDDLGTLNDFYGLLRDIGKKGLFDQDILLNQNGKFKNKWVLYIDEGIDETLKDISSKLGKDVRDELLHLSIAGFQNVLRSKRQEDVLKNIISEVKLRPEKQLIEANIELFKWLLEHDKLEDFDGYPILSCEEKFIHLRKGKRILAPKDIWDEKARKYAEIFPQDSVFSSRYFEKIPQKDKWEKLKDFVLTNPLYNETEKINGDNLALLSDETLAEDKEHGAHIELSKIPFLDKIIDDTRKSKEKARKFLGFLFDYVIEKDNYWNRPSEVDCICGSKHKIYASSWLGTLKDEAWVPSLRKGKGEKPNAQILASLVKTDKELLEKCRQDKPSTLLSRLNISVSEFMMNVAAENEETRAKLDTAMSLLLKNPSLLLKLAENFSLLTKIASLVEKEPELFIEEVDKRIQNAEEIERNKRVGTSVEKTIRDELEREGFEVERTGIGSDFIIRIRKGAKECFLEIKSTSQNFVKMTLTQAKEARDKSDRYVLCVVRLNDLEISEETIKSGAKFVTDIGQKIRDKVDSVENLKKEQEKITVAGDIEIEISEDIRFKINKRIWEDGKTLDQFFTFLRGL